MQPDAPLILNADDPHLAPLAGTLDRPVYTYGLNAKDADVTAEDVQEGENATTFTIVTKDGRTFPAELPCVGLHNVMNALAAYHPVFPTLPLKYLPANPNFRCEKIQYL